MKILVIGGSYFVGKQFVLKAKEQYEVTVFNRGTRPLSLTGVEEIHGDRRNQEDLRQLQERQFDIVVDFCAYQKGDISSIYNALQGRIRQYIFISTSDVYERGLNCVLSEDAPFETRDFGKEEGKYILGKVDLEKELLGLGDTSFTIFRPAFIYGPGNYAPREGIYFHWINQAGQILEPSDATGEFQMVYVEDVVKAIMCAAGNEKAYDQAYNLAPLPMITYQTFSKALEDSIDIPFEIVPVTVQIVLEKGIPLPFPLTWEESNWYDGTKVLSLIGEYTNLVPGIQKTLGIYEGEGIE